MPHPENNFGKLTDQLLSIGRRKATGTLRVTATSGASKHFYFQQGCLADLDTGREDTVLEAALNATGAFTDKDIKRARKASAKSGQTMGVALLELGIVPEVQVAEGIRSRLVEEFCEVFEWEIERIELFEHGAQERLEGFRSELADLYEALVDPEEVLISAALRLGRWDLVVQSCSLLADVVYATPGSFRYFREQEKYPIEHAILSKVDGTKDVEEVIAESGLDPFEAILVVRTLQSQGDLELINPVQMYQLGVECMTANKFEKAAKLFRRAHERGLDDFDLQLKLAQSLDSVGKHAEAIRRYMDFGEKCIQQLRVDDAIRCLRRVIKLDPAFLEAQEKLLAFLIDQNRPAEAIEQAVSLAETKSKQGNPRAGLEILIRVRSLNPREIKLQQKIIDLAEAAGDHPMARAEREMLARNCDERKDVEMALETYQKMFCDGDDSLEVRLKLVNLHRARGNRQKALDHIGAILNLPEKKRVKDESLLILLHETVRELKPSDLRSNRWLADHYSKSGDKAKASAVLKGFISHLETEGDHAEVVHAYEQLVAIGDDAEHRWGLARVLEKLGRLTECRRELRSLANLSLRKKELDQASRALDYILKTAPLDVETRKMQAELYEAREEADLAARKHEEIALLSILSGNVLDAESHCRRLTDSRPELAEAVRRLGRLCQDLGDRQKAVEQTIKAAKFHLQSRNFGLCQVAVEQLFAIEAGHPEGKAILADMKAREAPPPAPPPPPPPPVQFVQPVPAPPPVAAAQVAPAASVAPPVQAATAPAPPPAPAIVAVPEVISPHLQEPLEREPFQNAKPVKTKVTGIMERLKKLKAGGISSLVSVAPSQGAAEPGAAAAPASPEAPAATSNAALKSAASRLKALAGKKAQEAAMGSTAPEGAGTAESAPHDAPAALEAMNDVNEKLAAAQQPGAENAATVKPLKLGKSASKLAELRKKS